MTGPRSSEEIGEGDGAWGTRRHRPEPPCGCMQTRFNHECDCTSCCTGDCTNANGRCAADRTIDTIRLVGASGGSGTSTIAAILAMHAATMLSTELITGNAVRTTALLGVGPPVAVPHQVMNNLSLATSVRHHEGLTVIDEGSFAPTSDDAETEPGVRRIGVLRGPCYLALRTLMAAPYGIDGLIVVVEAGRALDERDVADVTSVEVLATVAATANVARTIDAGLLFRRYRNLPEFRAVRRWLTLQLDPFPTCPTQPTRAAPNHPSMSGTDLPLPPDGERGWCKRRSKTAAVVI